MKAKKAAFYTEMLSLEEEKQGYLIEKATENNTETSCFLDENVTTSDLLSFSNTLKAEIIYMRSDPGAEISTKTIWENNLYNCNEAFLEENLNDTTKSNLATTIYYLKKSKDYVYDEKTDTIYKVKDTKIGKYTVHSLVYAKLMLDGIGFSGHGLVDMTVSAITSSDGTIFYEPNLNDFTYETEIIYYADDMTTYSVNVRDYIQGGKKNNIEFNEKQYTFANYVDTKTATEKTIWGNIRCTANGLETNWVWIPRYAYKLDTTTKTSDIIFIDLNDKPLDQIKYGTELPDGYTPHEAFTQDDGLYGIWYSKYEPSYIESQRDCIEPKAPDMSNFNSSNTKLIYYNLQDLTDTKEMPYSENPSQTYTENGTTYYFYKYVDKIWANVKCTANGLETNWVWIPRYAYKLGSATNTLTIGLHTGEADIILVDENDKPIDTEKWGNKLPEGYRVHDAFNQDGNMKGIWFSKYEPSQVVSK